MSKLSVTFSSAVSLRAEDFGCYLESQGSNEPPTARRDDGRSLLSFERSVFRLETAEGTVVQAKGERPIPYGGSVKIVCPTTQLCAVVVKTESGAKSRVGYKIVMRPNEAGVSSSNSRFRILSKYKQRSEMDHVFSGDNVVLLLENSDVFVNLVDVHGVLEIVASLEPCSWTVTRYDRGYSFGAKSTIAHAGRVIAFEHRTHGALLTCGQPTNPTEHKRSILRRSQWQVEESSGEDEGTSRLQAARAMLPERTTDVYFQVNSSEDGTIPVVDQFSCSCNALWIVENADPSIGGPLQVGEQYRIRHVSTGRYLAVVESVPGRYSISTLGLFSPKMLEQTLFDMDASAEDDQGHISSYHSYVRLKSVAFGVYLGAVECAEYAVVPTIANVRMNTRDRIVLRHPSPDTEQRLFVVMSHAAFLHQYLQRIEELRQLPVSPERAFQDSEMKKLLERVNETVLSLLQFCSTNAKEVEMAGAGSIDAIESMPEPQNQKMMAELGIVDLLVTVLCAPFHNGERDIPEAPLLQGIISLSELHERQHSAIRNVTKLCFRLLTQIVKGSPSNAKLVMQHLDLLLYFEQFDLRTADTLKALLASSDCLSDEKAVDVCEKFFSLNQHRPTASYASSLAQLCIGGVAGLGRPAAQRCVLALLEKNPGVLPGQSIELSRLIITPPKVMQRKGSSEVDNALAVELFISHGEVEVVEYLGSCGELLLSLAIGNLPECVDYVCKMISREHVLLMLQATFRDAKNPNLADNIRAIYTMLAIQLYLKRDIELSTQPRMLVVSQASERGQVAAITGDGAFVRQMKVIAFEAMKNSIVLVGDRPGKNRLLTNCGVIWDLFIRARMAPNSELQELIPILLSMLDGSNDLPSILSPPGSVWTERFLLTDRTQAIIRCKIQICAIIQSYLTVVCEESVGMVGALIGQPEASPESCVSTARSYVKEQLQLIDVKKTTSTLLDLVLYESPELVRVAVSLLAQVVTVDQRIAEEVKTLHVLDPSQSDTYARIVQLVGVLKTNKNGPFCSEEVLLSLQGLTENLKQIVAAENADDAERFVQQGSFGQQHSPSGVEKDDGLEYLSLLRIWGVHDMALSMIPSPMEQDQFAICTDFFTVFCSDLQNAELIAPKWPLFFEAMEANPDLRDCVLPLLVKLWPKGNMVSPVSRHDVRVVTQIFVTEGSAVSIAALRAVLGSGAPRPYQQRDIATVLTEENVFVDNWWLNFKPTTVLGITDLLTVCGQGNSFVRNLFQRIFPASVVIRLLQSSSLSSLNFKAALLRFLVSIHLVEFDDSETSANRLQRQAAWIQDEVWWRVIRDDFLVRLDELMTSSLSNDMLHIYTIECALCMEAFFRTVFSLNVIAKFDWVTKELRSCVGVLLHLTATLPSLSALSSSEKHLMLMLAKATYHALKDLPDQGLPRLKNNIEKCVIPSDTATHHSSPHANHDQSPAQGDSAVGQKEKDLLDKAKELFSSALSEEIVERSIQPIVEQLRPPNLSDQTLPHRKVIAKLLRCCLHQELNADATVLMLRALRLLIEGTPTGQGKDNQLKRMQEIINSLGGMKTASVLLDAVNPDIILSALKLGISILEGGNTKVQNDFLLYLSNTDEKLFVGVKRSVEKATLELQHHRKLMISASIGRRKSVWNLNSSNNSFYYLTTLLRLIQLLCEGHNLGLQDYIREQKDNLRSVNTVQLISQFLQAVLGGPFEDLEELLIQCFQLLTEFCQGPCPGNQGQLVTCNTPSLIDQLLRNPVASDELKAEAVTALLSVVEGCVDSHIAEVVLRQVPIPTLEGIFMQKGGEEELPLMVGIFLREMADLSYGSQFYYEITTLLKKRPDIGVQTGKIEVSRNNSMELVYFRVPPGSKQIREDSKFKLLWEVDRSSQSSKLASFYELSDELMMELELVRLFLERINDFIQRHIPVRAQPLLQRIVNPSITSWIIFSVYLAGIINSLLILGLRTDASIFIPLGVLQLIVSLIVFFVDWEIEAKVHLHKYKKAVKHQNEVQRTDFTDIIKNEKLSGIIQSAWMKDFAVKMNRTMSMSSATMILSSVLGVIYSPYYYCVHLFWVVTLSPSLGNVVAAITQNKKTLSLTIVLGMMVCYAFSIIGFAVFPEDFDTDNDESSHENCNSLSHCFTYIVGTGLRQGGGVGDIMKARHFGAKNFIGRRLYDFLFFAIMIVVFLNILFGIIIDTFAELRDAKHRKEEDMRLKCFICGIDSHVFDRLGDGFEYHVKHEHNMWQYFYFMHHLRLKDPNDYTGQESYIAKLLELKDFSFFPTRCMSLEAKLQEQAASLGTDGEGARAEVGAVAGGAANTALTAMLGQQGNWGALGRGDAMQTGLDDIKTMLKRMFNKRTGMSGPDQSRQMPAGPPSISGSFHFGSPARGAVDIRSVSCQTNFGESVTELQAEVVNVKKALETSDAASAKLRSEMKFQVKEIWRLQQSVQTTSDLEHEVHQQQLQISDLRRQLDIALAEKDVIVRQNLFLQREADKLVTENSRMQTTERARGHKMAVSNRSSFGAGLNESLRESLMERSKLFESLQLEDESAPDLASVLASPLRRPSLAPSQIPNTPNPLSFVETPNAFRTAPSTSVKATPPVQSQEQPGRLEQSVLHPGSSSLRQSPPPTTAALDDLEQRL